MPWRTARDSTSYPPPPFLPSPPVPIVRAPQKELQDILAQRRQEQARETHPAESDDDDDDDDVDEDEGEDDDLLDLANGKEDVVGGENGAGTAGGTASDIGDGGEDELESVGDASLDLAASPEATTTATAAYGLVSATARPQEQQQAQGRPTGSNASAVAGTPPIPQGPPSQALVSVAPPPPPGAAAVAAGAGAGAGVPSQPQQRPQQGFASAVAAVAAAAVAVGQRAAEAVAPAAATASATARAAAAAPGPVPEPPRLKTLVAVLRRLGVPVLELAFFPAEQRSWLVVSDPNEAARSALGAIHALRNTLAPPYPISEVCEARRAAVAEGAMAAMAELIASGEDHGRDWRGRKLRLRWGALKGGDMDALLQVWSRFCRCVCVESVFVLV